MYGSSISVDRVLVARQARARRSPDSRSQRLARRHRVDADREEVERAAVERVGRALVELPVVDEPVAVAGAVERSASFSARSAGERVARRRVELDQLRSMSRRQREIRRRRPAALRAFIRSGGMSSATMRIGSPVTRRSSPNASREKNTPRDRPSDGYSARSNAVVEALEVDAELARSAPSRCRPTRRATAAIRCRRSRPACRPPTTNSLRCACPPKSAWLSRIRMRAPGRRLRQKYAAASPHRPPPTTTRSTVSLVGYAVEGPALAVAQRVRGVERSGLAALEAAVARRIAVGPEREDLGRRQAADTAIAMPFRKSRRVTPPIARWYCGGPADARLIPFVAGSRGGRDESTGFRRAHGRRHRRRRGHRARGRQAARVVGRARCAVGPRRAGARVGGGGDRARDGDRTRSTWRIPHAVEHAAAATARDFGRIDALVCSAGVAGPNHTTWEFPIDAWKRVFDINVHGVFYCNRAVVPIMLKRDYGRIVNIASVAGKEGNPNASAYSASKAAVIGLTKSLGKELAKTGIRVNCVTPAAVARRSSTRSRSSTSTSCWRRSRWGASAASTRSRRWCAGSRARTARSRPGRCSTCREAGRRIERGRRTT